MIRKTIQCVALLAALSTSTAFADTKAVANKYYSAPYSKAVSTAMVPATNIAVLNYSDNTVYASVPGLTLTLFSGYANTFRHDTYFGDSYLTLQDPSGVVFYNQYVCHRAIVTIDGRPGYYRTTVDGHRC